MTFLTEVLSAALGAGIALVAYDMYKKRQEQMPYVAAEMVDPEAEVQTQSLNPFAFARVKRM